MAGKKVSLSPDRGKRKYFGDFRRALHQYEDLVRKCRRPKARIKAKYYKLLYKRAGEAIDRFGGQAEPSLVSLKEYNHRLYGPFLGISDEGSAAVNIREAALASPKMRAIGSADPIVVGVSHDAERLAAVGEVAVGPSEYREIRLECMGRILTSTNVGTRLNMRYYKKRPLIDIAAGPLKTLIKKAEKEAGDIISPFWHTPDKKPREITVFVRFSAGMSLKRRIYILKALTRSFKNGKFCDPQYHRLGLLVRVDAERRGLKTAMAAVGLARAAGLAELILDGVVRKEAEDKISMPGLLNYFGPKRARRLLRYAAKKRISVSPRNLVDPDTVARNIWSSLSTARRMGLELGKYGLFPLTLPEGGRVMKMIQGWFPSWTAAPAFYVDFPAADAATVYDVRNISEAIKKWLNIVARHKIPVVLIDTADKDKGRKLLKNSPSDKKGILFLREVADIDAFARKRRIKVLWAGGITVRQVFEIGKLGVFGVYVTTAAAVARPITTRYERDPMISSEKEPTFHGVYRVKLLLESGFLIRCLKEYGREKLAAAIEQKAGEFLALTGLKSRDELASLLIKAWRIHFRRAKGV